MKYGITAFFAHKESLLKNGKRTSSSCTGVYTAEMGFSLIARTTNESRLVNFEVDLECVSCHEPLLMSCHQSMIRKTNNVQHLFYNQTIPGLTHSNGHRRPHVWYTGWSTEEFAKECHQLIIDNHKWSNEVSGFSHEPPCIFEARDLKLILLSFFVQLNSEG